MDDDQIIARGGDEYDIAAYAEANGATDVLKGMTIEEVLLDALVEANNPNRVKGIRTISNEALATIKQLVLESVIAEDTKCRDGWETCSAGVCWHKQQNHLRSEQRQALEKVIGGRGE